MREGNRAIVLDADFLSSFLKIGKLGLIRDFFKVEVLYIPVAVFSEISKTEFIKELLEEKYIKIERAYEKNFGNFGEDFENLGSGEKECIALCRQFKNSLLLISDKKALGVARKGGIAVLNIPAFLLACKSTAFLSSDEVVRIIKDLKQRDFYEFSNEERRRLLS